MVTQKVLSLNELAKELEGLGVHLESDLIREYYRKDLAPGPVLAKRDSKEPVFLEEVIQEYVASYHLMKKLEASLDCEEIVRKVRKIALKAAEIIMQNEYPHSADFFDNEELQELVRGKELEGYLAGEWLTDRGMKQIGYYRKPWLERICGILLTMASGKKLNDLLKWE